MSPTTEKPMDPTQATQRIMWLDEERRRDHAELARLTQELSSALSILKDQAVRIRESGDRLNAVESTLTRLPRIEDAITLARSELLPLRDTDIHLQDEITRHSKDRQVQNDASARLWGEINSRLELIGRSIDGLANRLHVLETQRKEIAERVGDQAGRLDILAKSIDGLAGRLQLLETREPEHVSREVALQTQLTRLESNQGVAVEEVRRSVARVEALVSDIQNMRREIMLAHEENEKQRKAEASSIADQRELISTAQRRVESIAGEIPLVAVRLKDLEKSASDQREALTGAQRRIEAVAGDLSPVAVRVEDLEKSASDQREALTGAQRRIEAVAGDLAPVAVRVENLEESILQIAEVAHRLTLLEEQTDVLQSTYKSLQEVEDRHWGTDIPQILDSVEQTQSISEANAATVQELIAESQAIKEDTRALRVALTDEHVFTEDLAAALRLLIEEDLQSRMAITQKQLQNLRRLANAPVESTPEET